MLKYPSKLFVTVAFYFPLQFQYISMWQPIIISITSFISYLYIDCFLNHLYVASMDSSTATIPTTTTTPAMTTTPATTTTTPTTPTQSTTSNPGKYYVT